MDLLVFIINNICNNLNFRIFFKYKAIIMFFSGILTATIQVVIFFSIDGNSYAINSFIRNIEGL